MDKTSTKTGRTAFGQDRVTELAEKQKAEMYRRALMIFEQLAGRKIRPGESQALHAGMTNRKDGDTNWWGLSMAAELAKDGYALQEDDALKKVFKGSP